jgi:ubiquinone/menaquinone biosynthesis C-methylase UbiE
MSTGAVWGTSFGGLADVGLRVYDEVMVPRMFGPWGRLLLDQLAIAPGESVLDIGCGPGSVTRPAAERVGPGGRVTGCDLSARMLALARGKPPVAGGAPIEYREGRADRLPVEDGSHDVISCQQALQFFPDRPAALREMRRALRTGGRIGISVWASIDRSPPFCALADGVEEVAGAELADRYRGGPFALPDGEQLRALLQEAGFEDVSVAGRALPTTFEGGAAQVVVTLAVTPLAAEIDRLSADQRRRLVAAVARRTGDGPIRSRLESNIALARR